MMVLSSSSTSATVAVENATSDGLMSPDRAMNIEICTSTNSNHWQAKDVVKAVKKRLQHKNPNIQFLSLMLLDTMVQNCGDSVHSQIAEKKILEMMIKIVKKKADTQVGEKILVLLDSWQEAFGGNGGKHPQYYYAYEELRRSGVEFPERYFDAAPTFTPTVTHPTIRIAQPGYGMPSNTARMLDETTATEIESLSINDISNVTEVSSDVLQALNLSDPAAIASGASGASVFVIGPQYYDPSTGEHEIRRDAQGTYTFSGKDVNDDFIFRVHREKGITLGGVLVDRAGNPIVLIKKQIPTGHGRWAVYKGKSMEESILIFSVRRPTVTREKTKLVVFLAVNKKEKVCDFRMEESQSESLPVIYSGESSTKVAEMYKEAVTGGISTSEGRTMVKIYPDIDRAFIVTLIAIHEWIKEIGENRKKIIRRAVEAGKVGGKVAIAMGAQLLGAVAVQGV